MFTAVTGGICLYVPLVSLHLPLYLCFDSCGGDLGEFGQTYHICFSAFVAVFVLIITFPASPVFHSRFPSSLPPPVSLSDLADNLAMDDFTFQEQLLTPGLATAGAGGVSSSTSLLWGSNLVLPVMLAQLLLCRH